jgi:hypothetical protein
MCFLSSSKSLSTAELDGGVDEEVAGLLEFIVV